MPRSNPCQRLEYNKIRRRLLGPEVGGAGVFALRERQARGCFYRPASSQFEGRRSLCGENDIIYAKAMCAVKDLFALTMVRV